MKQGTQQRMAKGNRSGIITLVLIPGLGALAAWILRLLRFDPFANGFSRPDPWGGLLLVGLAYFGLAYVFTRSSLDRKSDFFYLYGRKRNDVERDLEEDNRRFSGKTLFIAEAIVCGIAAILAYAFLA